MRFAPGCPLCQAEQSGSPDCLGVRRCRTCGVEFRPPVRVPIRRAGVSAATGPDIGITHVLACAVLLTVGVAVAFDDTPRATDPTLQTGPPSFAPSFESSLDRIGIDTYAQLGLVANLGYELETTQLYAGELFVTGQVHNRESRPVSLVGIEVSCRTAQGDELERHEVTVACPEMTAGQRCPWALDVALPPGAVDFEFSPHGVREQLVVFERVQVEQRVDQKGEPQGADRPVLGFDPETRIAWLDLDSGLTVSDVWITVTALDAEDKLLGVHEGRATTPSSEHAEVRISGVRQDEAVASYHLRAGGRALRVETEIPQIELNLPKAVADPLP